MNAMTNEKIRDTVSRSTHDITLISTDLAAVKALRHASTGLD